MLTYWRQDTSLKIMNLVFTAGSCGLSGYCGWLLASDLPYAIQVATALIFGGIAYGLSEAIVWRTRYRLARDREGYVRNTKLALFLLVANLATDYSASSTLRDLAKTNTEVQNTNASNAINEVARLEKRASEIRAQTAWQSTYLAPSAYDSLIDAARLIRDNEARRGGCGPLCERKTTEMAELQANKANAEQRAVLVAEMKQVSEELRNAKSNVKETPKVGNPALAPIIGLVSWATLSLDHETAQVQWGLNSFVLMLTAVITAAIWYFSSELGTRAGPMRPREEPTHAPPQPDYWGERALPAPVGHKPIPLKAESISSTEYNISYSGNAPPSVDRLQEMIRQLDAKANA
jgi:hypothetical protein